MRIDLDARVAELREAVGPTRGKVRSQAGVVAALSDLPAEDLRYVQRAFDVGHAAHGDAALDFNRDVYMKLDPWHRATVDAMFLAAPANEIVALQSAGAGKDAEIAADVARLENVRRGEDKEGAFALFDKYEHDEAGLIALRREYGKLVGSELGALDGSMAERGTELGWERAFALLVGAEGQKPKERAVATVRSFDLPMTKPASIND
jgi:hypothetical protein